MRCCFVWNSCTESLWCQALVEGPHFNSSLRLQSAETGRKIYLIRTVTWKKKQPWMQQQEIIHSCSCGRATRSHTHLYFKGERENSPCFTLQHPFLRCRAGHRVPAMLQTWPVGVMGCPCAPVPMERAAGYLRGAQPASSAHICTHPPCSWCLGRPGPPLLRKYQL